MMLVLQVFLFALGLFLFVHRMISSPYREFRLRAVNRDTRNDIDKLSLRIRANVWFYLYWRYLASGLLLILLGAPLNVLISLIGLRAIFGIPTGLWINTLAYVFVIGPVLVKMLVAHSFAQFQLEASRGEQIRSIDA